MSDGIKRNKPLRYAIDVEISDIIISDTYYYFEYVVTCNGKSFAREYESDHIWREDKQGFLELLESGSALDTAIEDWLSRKDDT